MDETIYDEQGNVIYNMAPGEQEGNLLSVDYYRGKVTEFQKTLQAMDVTYQQLTELGYTVYALNDPAAISEYESLMTEFQGKLSYFRTTSQAIQLASQGINALGVNFPSVQLPAGLSALPAVPLAAAAAAIAAAIALITWATQFFATVRDAIRRWQTLDAIQQLPEGDRAAALSQLQAADTKIAAAQAAADSSPLASLASFGKWAAIAVIAYFGYKALKER